MYNVRVTIPCGPLMVEEDFFVETASEVDKIVAYGDRTGEFTVRYTMQCKPKVLCEILDAIDKINPSLMDCDNR